jgi:hypothetical protein
MSVNTSPSTLTLFSSSADCLSPKSGQSSSYMKMCGFDRSAFVGQCEFAIFFIKITLKHRENPVRH